jgi:hypothetical protein
MSLWLEPVECWISSTWLARLFYHSSIGIGNTFQFGFAGMLPVIELMHRSLSHKAFGGTPGPKVVSLAWRKGPSQIL